jgi:hypothetical protein
LRIAGRTIISKLLDDIVICIAVGLGLLIALFLAWESVRNGANYPPTLMSAFLGIAIAALTYRFLGGSAETQFSMGVLKLGGSAALLLGTTWFVGDRLREEIKLFSSMDTYRQQLAALESENAKRGDEVALLKKQLLNAPNAKGVYTIEEIKKLAPNDPFVRDIKGLVEGQEGPFRQTIKDVVVRVSVIATPTRSPRYNICTNTLALLNEGQAVPSTDALFLRTLGDGSEASVRAQRAGKISADICESSDRAFDVQVNCAVAEALFPDIMPNCADSQAVRGMKVTMGAVAN